MNPVNSDIVKQALINQGLSGIQLALAHSQAALESGGFVKDKCFTNNNYSGIIWAGQVKYGFASLDYIQPIRDGGKPYCHFNSADKWAEYFKKIISKQNNPLGATTVSEYVYRLKLNGYFGAAFKDYLKGVVSWLTQLGYTVPIGSLTAEQQNNIDRKDAQTFNVNMAADAAEANSATADGKLAENPLNKVFDFSKLAQNIQTQELDDTDVSWGSRSTALEESDYIGLKQYIIYLVTRYYPHSLIPFVELIPNFEIGNLEDEGKLTEDEQNKAEQTPDSTGKKLEDLTNSKRDAIVSDKIVDEERYERTRAQLKKLSDQGGTDLTNYDPFEEFSESFNVPNEAGKNFFKKRNLSYKIYGNLVLNPSSESDALSKPGAIGLKSITIEHGSQSQNGMTLITVKILDVQGNKLLDINSPWSFLLNNRAGQKGGDFWFRYGWQVKIPEYRVDNNYKNDPQAGKFWNHIGWGGLFFARSGENLDNFDKGDFIKRYIYKISSESDNTLTFTQSVTEKSLRLTGYESTLDANGKTSYKVKRDADFFNYYALTLLTPEISVNPKDGSVEANLVFRTNAATANCLCPLNGQGLDSSFETRALVSSKSEVTLAELMNAFVNDNMKYSRGNPSQTDLSKTNIYYSNKDINSWLTVMGGMGKDSRSNINPADIKVKISTDAKDDIINATNKDSRLLITWLNQVLSDNNMAILTAADKSAGVQQTEGFLISYDSDQKGSAEGTTTSNSDLAKKDITFGDFLKMVEVDETNPLTFAGSRLFTQDDVFSFRFQGSLVEDIQIEKLNAPNASTYEAQKNFASSEGESDDTKDVEKKSEKTTDANSVAIARKTSPVSLVDKQKNLSLLYDSMLGLKVVALCHPWLKLTRTCYVKGMGIFDGGYTITRIVHELNTEGKFTSTINASRILDSRVADVNEKKRNVRRLSLMNSPGAKQAEKFFGTLPRGSAIKPGAPVASLPPAILNSDGAFSFLTQPVNNAITATVGKLSNAQEAYIKNLHPSYQTHFRMFIKEFEQKNPQYRVLITSGYRTFAEQASLKAENKANAAPGHSTHNYGLALDVNITDTRGNVVARKSSDDSVWISLGIIDIANKYGLTWGGTAFGTYKDRVHFGLDKTFNTNILLYLARQQFGNNDNLVQGNQVKIS